MLKDLDAEKPKVDPGIGEGTERGSNAGKERGGSDETRHQPLSSGNQWWLVTFLGGSLFLLVCLVVFFPNRLRPVVPKVEFSAAGARDVLPPAPAPELDHVGAADADMEMAAGPPAVRLQQPCANPEEAVERITGFLADGVALRFYLAPSLAAEHRSRIVNVIHALIQEAAVGNGRAGDQDNDLPAA